MCRTLTPADRRLILSLLTRHRDDVALKVKQLRFAVDDYARFPVVQAPYVADLATAERKLARVEGTMRRFEGERQLAMEGVSCSKG